MKRDLGDFITYFKAKGIDELRMKQALIDLGFEEGAIDRALKAAAAAAAPVKSRSDRTHSKIELVRPPQKEKINDETLGLAGQRKKKDRSIDRLIAKERKRSSRMSSRNRSWFKNLSQENFYVVIGAALILFIVLVSISTRDHVSEAIADRPRIGASDEFKKNYESIQRLSRSLSELPNRKPASENHGYQNSSKASH